jgi:hypothetical protein
MADIDIPSAPPVPVVGPTPGGIQFGDAAPMLCGVVDNGVAPDDPRVMVRANEATKIVLDTMIPVGGMAIANVQAVETFLHLPKEMENVIEAYPIDPGTVNGNKDVRQGWYEIVNNSVYLDPGQHHDNPLVDWGLWADPDDFGTLRRTYEYPGLQPVNSIVRITGAKRFVPITNNEDYLIVQNIEALKLIILSIERNENSLPDDGQKYRQQGLQLLEAEVKKHIIDPRNYMRRKAEYQKDLTTFPENSLGWVRAQIALDIMAALKTGKMDLTWSINQAEKRMMGRGIFKDCITSIKAEVTGGMIYFPLNVGSVLAADLSGRPIPIRSRFFESLENGPGQSACSDMLVDQGDHFFPSTRILRRKYKLNANCQEGQCLTAICRLRWLYKQPQDLMVIKNYEAIRLMMTAKFLEEEEKWQEAMATQQQAFQILDGELREYLSGILHTIRIQTDGFGLGDVGGIL